MWRVALDIRYDGRLSANARWLFVRRDVRKWLRPARLSSALSSAPTRDVLANLARHVRASRFEVALAYSLGDACLTALTHGGLCAVLSALSPHIARAHPHIALSPAFDEGLCAQGHVAVSVTLPLWVLAAAHVRLYNERKKERETCTTKTA